jgi:hypothetical protein
MASRGQALTLTYVAWDRTANAGKTGDAGNHTLRWIKDGTAAAPAATPQEIDAVHVPGLYRIALTGTECTCHLGVLAGSSSTAGVTIVPVTISFEQLPTAAAGTNGGLPTVDANNRITGVQWTVGLSENERNAVADSILTRSVAVVEGFAAEHSLATIVLAILQSSINGTTWTIKRTNNTTTHVVKTVTRDSKAVPITEVR